MGYTPGRMSFMVRLNQAINHEVVDTAFPFPVVPMPGMRFLHAGDMWEVVSSPQISIPQPGSITEREGGPISVDVIVIKAEGIFVR